MFDLFLLCCAFVSAYLTTLTIYCGILVIMRATTNVVLRWLVYAASFVLLGITAGSIIDLYHFNVTTMVCVRIAALVYATIHFWFFLRHKIVIDVEKELNLIPHLKTNYVNKLVERERQKKRMQPKVYAYKESNGMFHAVVEIEGGVFHATASEEKTAQQWAAKFALQYTK